MQSADHSSQTIFRVGRDAPRGREQGLQAFTSVEAPTRLPRLHLHPPPPHLQLGLVLAVQRQVHLHAARNASHVKCLVRCTVPSAPTTKHKHRRGIGQHSKARGGHCFPQRAGQRPRLVERPVSQTGCRPPPSPYLPAACRLPPPLSPPLPPCAARTAPPPHLASPLGGQLGEHIGLAPAPNIAGVRSTVEVLVLVDYNVHVRSCPTLAQTASTVGCGLQASCSQRVMPLVQVRVLHTAQRAMQ